MKRMIILLVLLTACATEPSPPSAEAVAIWSHFGRLCGFQGSDIIEGMKADPALKGCVITKLTQADAEWRRGQTRQPNVLEEMGSVLESAGRRQPICTTSPDYRGGFTTTCY